MAVCPALAVQARFLDIELQLHEPLRAAPSGLLQQLTEFARAQLLLRRLQKLAPAGPQAAFDPLPPWVPATTASTPINGLPMPLLESAQRRVVAMLRTWVVYNSRPFEMTTDNNCEGQWCFFEPCAGNCPDELCFDTRIDAMELTGSHSTIAIEHLLDPAASWPWLLPTQDGVRHVKLEGMPRFNIKMVDSVLTDDGLEGEVQHYTCDLDASSDAFTAVARAFLSTTFIGCIATRIALELICSAGDADQGRIGDAIARLFSAAFMATLCVDCVEGWQLPLRPAGLWYAAGAALENAESYGLPLRAGDAGPVDRNAARKWWREALAEARAPMVPKWEGPEVTVCPVELEDGVVLTCEGLEVGQRSRFANAIAAPSRPFLRACRSALRYHVMPRPVPDDGCDSRTLVLLPHADLIGHLINGLQWFLPLVWSVHAELGGPANVVIAVVDSGWVQTKQGMRFNTKDYEHRENPRFFLPLLPLLSASPPLFTSDLPRRGCPRLCFRRAVWGYRQLSMHRERLHAGRPRPGAAIYQEAMELWSRASPVVNDAIVGTDCFVPGRSLRLGPRSQSDSLAPSAAVVRFLFIQRTRVRRLHNLDELVAAAEDMPLEHGFEARVLVAGENGTAGWKAMSSLAQMGMARQADVMIGPSGNELGLAAFMQRGRFLLELMPPPVHFQDGSLYEILNCKEHWDANPNSLVGHVALRAHIHHACLKVSTPGGVVATVMDLEAPHWRHIPRIYVDPERMKEALVFAMQSMAMEPAWNYKAVDL